MPKFSATSAQRLETCDLRLQVLMHAVVEHFDCAILVGHRPEAEQNQAVAEGKSKLRWPQSKHNSQPSRAVDVAPYPIDWNDLRRFDYFAGFVMATAAQLGIPVRWGGDWDRDTQVKDEHFLDLVHFELVD